MQGDADVAAVAAVLGDRTRAGFVTLLLSRRTLTAGELAQLTGVSPSSASQHLRKLVDAGLLTSEWKGRQRWYRLTSAEVAEAVEALSRIAPLAPVRSLREATAAAKLRYARSCYDHLAGRIGVALTSLLLEHGLLVDDQGWRVSAEGIAWFKAGGIDVETLRRGRRPLLRPCLDWSERVPHLAGALGQALLERLLAYGWVHEGPVRRAVVLRPEAAVPPAWRPLLEEALVRAARTPEPTVG